MSLSSAPLETRRPARQYRAPSILDNLGDTLLWGVCRLAALSVLGLFGLMFVFLTWQAWPAILHFGPRFLTNPNWNPSTLDLGGLPFVYGTLVTSGLAMLLAVPLGVATAAFLSEIAPAWLRRTGSFLIELLAAIPSVVYGFWAIKFLAPGVGYLFTWLGGDNTSGDGLLSAGLILAIMIIPYVTAISYDVCRAVPLSQRVGALALGATRWQTIWSVVLPFARPGIVGGCFLALGRALGETMAVIMIIGNNPTIQFSLYATGATIPSQIALSLNESTGLQRSALVELGVLLLLVTIVVNCVARLLIWRVGRVSLEQAAADSGWNTVVRVVETSIGVVFRVLLWLGLYLLLAYLGQRQLATWTGNPAGWPTDLPILNELVLAGVFFVVFLARRSVFGKSWGKPVWVDRLMTGVLGVCLLITVVPLFLILGYITLRGATALDWDFFTRLPRDDPPGLLHAIVGTLILVALATVFAAPIGFLAAIFLAERPRSRLTPVVRFIGELLGGVPSVVVGIFGYALLVAPMESFSAWAGAFALGVMMIPVVMRSSEEAFRLVPPSIRTASYALGAASWQTVLHVLIPAVRSTIITGICLAIARIAGETAPLLLTANVTSYWPRSLNDSFPYLTYYIYVYSGEANEEKKNMAWAAAFVLLTVVTLVNVIIRLVSGRRAVLASRAD